MTDIAIIFGTRPSYIKLWPVWRALTALGIKPYVICTGQHDELVRQHMGVLDMPVHRWCHVMQDAETLNDTFYLVVERVAFRLNELRPRLVIVHGDTTSGLGAGLAAFHLGIPVAHVEAGLRSGHPRHPYPEEVNRIALDALATLLFAPTAWAAAQARVTNPVMRVEVTGNPVVDAVQHMLMGERRPAPYMRTVLLELHRRESFGPGLRAMAAAVIEGAAARGYEVVWPAHPNPAVQEAVSALHGQHEHVSVTPPMNYQAFLECARASALIATDSGGVVEEACTLGTPTLQLRDHTDRQEAVPIFSWLCGRDPAKIFDLVKVALDNAESWRRQIQGRANPFGDGKAGQRIAVIVKEWLERDYAAL